MILHLVASLLLINAVASVHECSQANLEASECGSTSPDTPTLCCAGLTCDFANHTCLLSSQEALTLTKSTAGVLLNLLHVSSDGIAPVARSYDGKDWEVSAGKYAPSISCDGSECILSELPALVDGEEYKVYTSSHSLPRKDEIARFLEQTTFGTTLSEINSFPTGDLQNAFASHIESQMNVPMSLHRSYFRDRLVYHLDWPHPIARPHHPCEKGTRYRRYAFTGKDKNRKMQVRTIATGKYLISVDGQPRTVVSTIDWASAAYINSKGSMPKTNDQYTICSEPAEALYGAVVVKDYRTNSCQAIKVNNNGGNAIVDFAGYTDTIATLLASEGNKHHITMSNYITLATADATPLNNLFYTAPTPQELLVTRDLEHGACGALKPELNLIHYIAYYQPSNIWVLHTPPPRIIENTVDNPAIDGGGYNAKWSKGWSWCSNAPRTFLNEHKCILSNDDNVCSNTATTKPLMVCGSPGETTSNSNMEGPRDRAIFDVANKAWRTTGDPAFAMYRKTVWLNNVLDANDQLRQRVAWALSQILVIAAPSIGARLHSEPFLSYYDIMVRNAFGNYFDVLKEVSFSPHMAENLSYLGSKSAAYMLQNSNLLVYPDENFAREIMQLFTIGYCKLNPDGTEITDNSATPKCIETYSNEEIMEYSRAWTGFTYNKPRGNMESQTNNNHIDPMDIEAEARDAFPKLGLNAMYIGDLYPLCSDMPEYHFLTKGAKYRLLGGSSLPELQKEPASWDATAVRMVLSPTSELYQKLCNPQADGTCNYASVVTLDAPLTCTESECEVETVKVVQVDGIHYEYISEPCVEQAFYNNPKTVSTKNEEFCVNPKSQVASTACCPSGSEVAVRNDVYWGERMSYDHANERCQVLGLAFCESPDISDCEGSDCDDSNAAYWTNMPCTLKVKIKADTGKVAIVHDSASPHLHVGKETTVTYFNVNWEGGHPTPDNLCGGSPDCQVSSNNCICPVYVENTAVFTQMPASKDEILSKLTIGAFEPSSLGYSHSDDAHGDFITHQPSIDDQLDINVIFEVTTDYGVTLYLKNVVSTVHILGYNNYFRNPPQFMKLADITKRDALHETDATLKQYFYHDNTAPFIVTRLIQRFGISNPSPNYVARVASAFRSGSFNGALSFGTGQYGDLAATIAALLLDPEARNVLLDADPSFGSFREPLLKAISLFRTFDVLNFQKHPLIETRLMALTDGISEEPFEAQSVFNFYLAEFSPHGPVNSASLVAPEAQLLTGPYVNGMMNGIFSIIKYGIHSSHGGLFHQLCGRITVDPGDYQCSKGHLRYTPTSTNSQEIVDELAMLMTSGRLSSESRQIAKSVYDNETRKPQAVMMVQQIIASSPEFQTTGLAKAGTESRPQTPTPTQSSEPYKAVVFVFLQGGMDSFNMLVPTCEPLKTNYLQKRQSVALSGNQLLPITTNTNQVCNSFGLHNRFANLRNRYNTGQVLFFANMGTISEPLTRNELWKEKSVLYAHNRMSEEVQRLDPYDQAPSNGVIGRLTDALSQLTGATSGKKYQIGSYSISGITTALAGTKGKSPNQIIVGKYGPTRFDPYPWSARTKWASFNLRQHIHNVNKLPQQDSNVFGSTWSKTFLDIIEENDSLATMLGSASVVTTFDESELSQQLMQVAKLIKIRNTRGVDRDFFFVSMSGWDHHQDMIGNTDIMFPILDTAIQTFCQEMQAQGVFDNVVLVATSEFGRSLSPNGGSGTDHGWGGNYFIVGGKVNGGRILGKYPDNFNGDLDAGRGRMIPTSSWDQVWNGIAQWLGVEDQNLLNQVLPNVHWNDVKFTKADLFK